jgi:hypothetical protein
MITGVKMEFENTPMQAICQDCVEPVRSFKGTGEKLLHMAARHATAMDHELLLSVNTPTRDEDMRKFLANPDVVAAVQRADDHPEDRREWERRTPRATESSEAQPE